MVFRKGLTPLTIGFAIDEPNQLLVSGSLADDSSTVAFTGWKKSWNAKLRPANAIAGYHTFALDVPEGHVGDPAVPQGNGYGSCTVTSSGQLTLAGKLADGEALTASTFLGPNGEAMIFRTLYASDSKGSVLGVLTIGSSDLSGSFTWSRPAATTSGQRLYSEGFPAILDLTAQGGRYAPPSSPQAYLGLTPGTDNARLTFSAGGIESANVTAPFAVSVGLHSKASINVAGGINPRRATLALVEKSGAMSGTIALEDANPLPAPSLPRLIKRTITFQGIAVPIKGVLTGCGFFLLPQLPDPGPPPDTVTTSPVLSGQVRLESTP
jgi:hypothetical protein